MSATAGRPISGSPRPPHPPLAIGRRGSSRHGESAECKTFAREIAVLGHEPPRPGREGEAIWPLRNSWNRGTENLYSAWIEKLFDAPLDAAPSWPALHEVLRDRSRNILFNHLGLGEDSMGMVVRPDCADLPYFLRAYFSFKMGLPFGYSKCSRGGGGQPPKCGPWFSIQNPEPPPRLLLSSPRCSRLRPARCWTCFASTGRHVP